MKSRNCTSILEEREQILALACSELAADLRKLDPATYVLFFQTTNMPDVFEWINKIFLKHFPGNEMSFACTGQYMGGWQEPPTVSVDIEFEIPGVFAFFRLFFAEKGVAAELHHISFTDTSCDPVSNTRLLETGLREARQSDTL